jgi:branched-chain amino acid transport system ATP-binding protein
MTFTSIVNIPDHISEPDALLSIRGISKRFGNHIAVHNLSFNVRPGEIIGIFGDRGSGKANIMHLLSGEIVPSSGHIWFEGEDITYMPPEFRVRRGIARSAEIGSLFPDLTAAENVLIQGVQHYLPLFPRQGGKTYAEEARDLLDIFGLGKYADEQVESLSPVRQCLVAMAIGLASKPQLLLADAAGLSGNAAGAELAGALSRLSDRGTAVLFTSANLSPVMDICDRIVVLHGGEIIARGVPNRIVVESALGQSYRSYLQ